MVVVVGGGGRGGGALHRHALGDAALQLQLLLLALPQGRRGSVLVAARVAALVAAAWVAARTGGGRVAAAVRAGGVHRGVAAGVAHSSQAQAAGERGAPLERGHRGRPLGHVWRHLQGHKKEPLYYMELAPRGQCWPSGRKGLISSSSMPTTLRLWWECGRI